MENELTIKMRGTNFPNPNMLAMVKTIEGTKIHDMIMIKYGIKAHYLASAIEHYDLKDDEDIKNLQESFKKEFEQRQAENKKKSELTAEDTQKVNELGDEIGPVILDGSGMISVADFIKV